MIGFLARKILLRFFLGQVFYLIFTIFIVLLVFLLWSLSFFFQEVMVGNTELVNMTCFSPRIHHLLPGTDL